MVEPLRRQPARERRETEVSTQPTDVLQGSSSKLLLTIPECCAALSIKRSLLYRLLGQNRIRSVSLGRCRRIPVESLRQFIAELEAERAGGDDR